MNKKTFIIDTNVILSDATCIYKFENNDVVVPLPVLAELDNFKKSQDELGRNARHFSKTIDKLREQGSLSESVSLGESKGRLKVSFFNSNTANTMTAETDFNVIDNQILSVALNEKWNTVGDVVLVTKDVNLRIKADCYGLQAETYENDNVPIDDLYTGVREVGSVLEAKDCFPNEFIIVNAKGQKTLYRFKDNEFVPIASHEHLWGLEAKNIEQKLAFDILMDDDIKLVTMLGQAGSGKTLCALAAALTKTTDEFKYRRVLVSRPVMPMGKDIGFLPGDINEKLDRYMQPIYDNIDFLMGDYNVENYDVSSKTTKGKKPKPNEKKAGQFENGYQELFAAGILKIEPLLYIRGRSISNQILILDEAQNISKDAMKTIISRAGINTKIIVTGDISQIDDPYLDATSNGLTYLVDKFKDQPIAGHITLKTCERSELADLAAKIL